MSSEGFDAVRVGGLDFRNLIHHHAERTTFHDVSDTDGGLNANDSGSPFDGVCRPHHLIDARRVTRRAFKRQQCSTQ